MKASAALLPTLLLGLASIVGGRCPAQEPGKSSDEALDSLIEKLAEPKAEKPGAGQVSSADKKHAPMSDGGPASSGAGEQKKAGPAPGQRGAGKPGGGDVSGKDRELDELLEKLGESKDRPDAPGRGGAGEPGEPKDADGAVRPQKPRESQARGPELRGGDKELDERLEELTGRRRKKNRQQEEEGGGPLGDIVKEMRDVEQKLGKPETGSDTQNKQKQIVKRLETLIQQVKQSGSQGQMAMRMARQQGQKPGGQQQGQTPGANPGGAPPMKPGKPPERHALAGGKDIWGHLPAELRQEMENVFKEDALPAKEDLIKRYYLSIAKQKLRRGE